jgi:hypothetical protein
VDLVEQLRQPLDFIDDHPLSVRQRPQLVGKLGRIHKQALIDLGAK